jgi:hypothetical protein
VFAFVRQLASEGQRIAVGVARGGNGWRDNSFLFALGFAHFAPFFGLPPSLPLRLDAAAFFGDLMPPSATAAGFFFFFTRHFYQTLGCLASTKKARRLFSLRAFLMNYSNELLNLFYAHGNRRDVERSGGRSGERLEL